MIDFIMNVKRFLRAIKYNFYPQVSSFKRKRLFKKTNRTTDLKIARLTVDMGEMESFILSQTPGRKGLFGKTFFVSHGKADIYLAVNKPNPVFKLPANTGKNWLLHIEPPSYIGKLGLNDKKRLKHFSRVYTSDPDLYKKGGKFIASPPFVHWHIGCNAYIGEQAGNIDYDFLYNAAQPKKLWNLSVINSNLNTVAGHRLRAEFIEKICEANLDFKLFGGSNWQKYTQYIDNAPLGKWAAFSPAKYVLVIENESAPYYWSEKFADALLCYCMPVYYGCSNIDQFFPKACYVNIDITQENAVKQLQEIIESDLYEKNIEQIFLARTLILEKLNMFAFIDHEINCNYEN